MDVWHNTANKCACEYLRSCNPVVGTTQEDADFLGVGCTSPNTTVFSQLFDYSTILSFQSQRTCGVRCWLRNVSCLLFSLPIQCLFSWLNQVWVFFSGQLWFWDREVEAVDFLFALPVLLFSPLIHGEVADLEVRSRISRKSISCSAWEVCTAFFV